MKKIINILSVWCVIDMKLLNTYYLIKNKNKQTPWSESASELYRPSDRRMSAK
jgi:hypothetical protein